MKKSLPFGGVRTRFAHTRRCCQNETHTHASKLQPPLRAFPTPRAHNIPPPSPQLHPHRAAASRSHLTSHPRPQRLGAVALLEHSHRALRHDDLLGAEDVAAVEVVKRHEVEVGDVARGQVAARVEARSGGGVASVEEGARGARGRTQGSPRVRGGGTFPPVETGLREWAVCVFVCAALTCSRGAPS